MRRHAFDPLSFVFGMLFFAGGALMLSGATGVAPFANERVWPIIAIGAGLLFLVPGVTSAREKAPEQRSQTGSATGPTEASEPAEADSTPEPDTGDAPRKP